MLDDPQQLMVLLTGTLVVLALRWLLGWRTDPEPAQQVRELLADGLEGISLNARVDREHRTRLMLHEGDQTAEVRLAQISRRCDEFPDDIGLIVRDAAQAVRHALLDPDGLPEDWRDRAYPLLVGDGAATPPDAVLAPGPPGLRIGLVLDGHQTFRWVTHTELAAADVTPDDARTVALRNLERSCARLVIEPLGDGDGAEGAARFNTGDALDAARVLLPDFHGRFAPRFGDELIVAIPTRDLLVITGARDVARTGFLAWRARLEYGRRAYPVAERVLRITGDGVETWAGREEPAGAEA